MRIEKLSHSMVGAVITGLLLNGAAFAQSTTVEYKGNGFTFDGTTYNLNDERCGAEGQSAANDGSTGQFATWNSGSPYQVGQPYLVWVLTANGASSATLTLPGGQVVSMFQVGGTFKYASPYFTYSTLMGPPAVSATFEGRVRGTPVLTISHGCKPMNYRQSAWCSPGYWRNAQDAAWALVGVDRATALFNGAVSTAYYGQDLSPDQLLQYVLDHPQTYSGPGVLGTDPTKTTVALNAFNATGAYLTDRIPGYRFDETKIGDEQACPIDNGGNFKVAP